MTTSTAIDFLYLSEPDMIAAGVTDMAGCVDTMEEMFRLLGQGDFRMAGTNCGSHGSMVTFPDTSDIESMPKNADDRRFMAMPAYIGGRFGTTGVKWYGSNMENRGKGLPRSIHMFTLNDTDTGAPCAVMSANLLSAYRTGAVPGVGARYFAKPDSRVVGILGPGVMARTSLEAFVVACPSIDTIKVRGRSQGGVDAFTAFVREKFPQITTIEVCDSNEAVCADADIVTYCTTGGSGGSANYPPIRREWLKPGAFLSMPSYVSIDEGLEAPDVRKVVDAFPLYEAWAEEVPKPTFESIGIIGCRFIDMLREGRLAREDIEEIGDVVAGKTPGRKDDDEIFLFSVGGMPVEDVAWATTVYRNAVEKGIGTSLNLWNTPALV